MTGEEKARRWNKYGRHITRLLAVLFMPVTTVLCVATALLDSAYDLRNNIRREIEINWKDFIRHWKLGSFIASAKDFEPEEQPDEDDP